MWWGAGSFELERPYFSDCVEVEGWGAGCWVREGCALGFGFGSDCGNGGKMFYHGSSAPSTRLWSANNIT